VGSVVGYQLQIIFSRLLPLRWGSSQNVAPVRGGAFCERAHGATVFTEQI